MGTRVPGRADGVAGDLFPVSVTIATEPGDKSGTPLGTLPWMKGNRYVPRRTGRRVSMTADAAYWDSQALTFDDQPDHGLRDPYLREAWKQLLLPQLPLAPAMIADLGCGTGSLTVLLAASGYTVTGLDIAPQMIRAARAKATAAGVSAQFVISDVAAPPLTADRFDVVLARHVLWAMPDIDAALDRWTRLLKPSGTLVLVEGRWHTGAGLTAAQAEQAVRRHRTEVAVTPLSSPLLWGGPVTDERYLLISPASGETPPN